MSPRRAAALRNATDDTSLRDHLITTAAQLIGRPSATAPTVRDIAREAGVAGGVLYNYFADKDELLAEALVAHVHAVMSTVAELPHASEATVEANLREFVTRGLDVLRQVVPAFSRFFSQPGVMAHVRGQAGLSAHEGLPSRLADYLRGEQALGRIDDRADPAAVAIERHVRFEAFEREEAETIGDRLPLRLVRREVDPMSVANGVDGDTVSEIVGHQNCPSASSSLVARSKRRQISRNALAVCDIASADDSSPR